MIQVLDRAFAIIQLVANESRPYTMSELAHHLGIQPTTCANIVKSLVQNGYLESLPERRGYVLGLQPFLLAQKSSPKMILAEKAGTHLKKLVTTIEETTLLAVLVGGKKVVLKKVDREGAFILRTHYFEETPPEVTPTGKLLLSFSGDAKWQKNNEAKTIRKTGHCILRTEGKNPFVGLAVPVNYPGILAALGVYFPVERSNPEKEASILAEMKQTARAIENEIPFSEKF